MDNISGKSPTVASMERPKRPLTAYNFFFHDERQKLLQELPDRQAPGSPTVKKGRGHGKIAFADMAKVISAKWKHISTKRMIYYANLANQDKFRYRRDMHAFETAREEQEERDETDNKDLDRDLEPIQFLNDSTKKKNSVLMPPSYSDLANKLDKESIEFLISALK